MTKDYTEIYSYENVVSMALANMPPIYRRNNGEIAFDAVAPNALVISNLAINLQYERDQMFPDTADREHLLLHARQQGVEVHPASKTLSLGVFNVEAQVTVGSRFSQRDLNFIVIRQQTDTNGDLIPGNFELQAEVAGAHGNSYAGTLIPIMPVRGLTSAVLMSVLIPGEDVEGTEEIREHVIQSYDTKQYGFNELQYKLVTESLQGVGGARPRRRVEGTSIVNVFIVGSDNKAPTQTLIDFVQESLDPIPFSGQGLGLVPIGHRTTVIGVKNLVIDVAIDVVLVDGWKWDDIKPYLQNTISDYFLELTASWSNLGREETLVARSALIISKTIVLSGLLDVPRVTLNGSPNVEHDYDEIPVLGNLTRI